MDMFSSYFASFSDFVLFSGLIKYQFNILCVSGLNWDSVRAVD